MKTQNTDNNNYSLDNEKCLIEEFFKREEKKPVFYRNKHCMISCPCKRCSVGTL